MSADRNQGPAEVDEFGEFENFASEEGELMSLPNAWAKDRLSGDYVYAAMRTAWRAWKARAALANTQPKGTPLAYVKPEQLETLRRNGVAMLDASDRAVGFCTAPIYGAQSPAPGPDVEAPDGAHEALQRLIENAASLGPASRDDARLVAKWRRPLLSARPVPSSA